MPAQRKSFLAILAAAMALATSAMATERRIEVQLVGAAPATRVNIVAHGGSGAIVSASVRLAESRKATLQLSAQEPWSIGATAEGLWTSPVELQDGVNAVTLRLWPAADVTFALRVSKGAAPPTQVRLRLNRGGGASGPSDLPPDSEVTCPVDARGFVLCTVPAGRWDIRTKCVGFVPQYTWDAHVDAGKRFDLHTLDLKVGVALLGRVVTEAGLADAKQARVEVRPLIERDAGAAGVPRSAGRLSMATGVSDRGYFQFDGLAPGAYTLSAKQTTLEAEPSTITMTMDADVELAEPVVLLQPLQLNVSIDPPVNPNHGEWGIVLLAIRSGDMATIGQGTADVNGYWRSRAIPSGHYTVLVKNSPDGTVAKTEFDLARDSQDLNVKLDVVPVEGTVQIGSEPFAAGLWFGGLHGDVRVKATSDEHGKFALILPRAGKWRVDVHGIDRSVDAAILDVDVELPKGKRVAQVPISLPNTDIRGAVHDRSGQTVAGATVVLIPTGGPGGIVSTETTDVGDFEIQGQPAGNYSIEAKEGLRASDTMPVMLVEDLTPPELDLVIEERRHLRGSVSSFTGPVPGAFVLAFPITADGRLAVMMIPQARTGLDGSFEIDLPPSTAMARVVATAMGYTLGLSTVRLADGPDPAVALSLDQAEGTLELTTLSPENAAKLTMVMMINGQPIDVGIVNHWAQAHGAVRSPAGAISVQAMPPGTYSYCKVTSAEAMLVFTGTAMPSPRNCVEGYLTAGGRLALTPPGAN